jgi:4-hydroxy-tetrahydrodipicolinate synthase
METNMPPEAFAHVLPAMTTPFKPGNLEVDTKLLAAHAKWLLAHGCDGLVLFGTTGEAASLSVAERKSTLESLLEAGIAACRILVGTGCCANADTVELMRHAARLECAGALLLPPFFYKGVSEAGTARAYELAIAGCGSHVPPIYLYHIPQVSGVSIGPDLVGQLIDRHGDLIRGYKDSSGQWANTAEILSRFPKLHMYVGSEQLLLDNLRAGGVGCISASANVQPAGLRRIYDGWRGPDAAALQANATEVRLAFEKPGPLLPATKAMVGEIHGEPTWFTPRPPLLPLEAPARAALREKLHGLGVEGL